MADTACSVIARVVWWQCGLLPRLSCSSIGVGVVGFVAFGSQGSEGWVVKDWAGALPERLGL